MGLFLRDPGTVTAAAAPISRTHGRAAPAAYGARRPITGSAQPIKLGGLTAERPYAAWQAEAWIGYEKVGEIHYGLDQLAKLLSRVRVYAGVTHNPADPPMEASKAAKERHITTELAEDAVAAVAELVSSDFSAMLRAFCLNVSVPGECYLIRMPDHLPRFVSQVSDPATQNRPTTYTWVIRSTDEVRVKPTGIELVTMRGGGNTEGRDLPKDTYVARIWKASPRHSSEPDSSMIGIADAIEELLLLSRVTRATARSRLSAGVFFIPDSIVVAGRAQPDPQADPATAVEPADEFMTEFMESIVTPISDEGSAAGVVPLVLTGPAGEGEKIKYIPIARPVDEKITADKERALERILQGLDIPKEIVTGLANVKYTNAAIIDENLYKANIEPLALMFVDAMTTVYLRPVLRGMLRGGAPKYTEDDLAKLVLWYDPSEIVTRPNAAADATEGYNLGLLNGDAWRDAHGWGENDAPSEAELATMLATRPSATIPEATMQAFLQRAFPEVLGAVRQENLDAQPVPFPKSAQDILQPDAPDVSAPADEVLPADAPAPGGQP